MITRLKNATSLHEVDLCVAEGAAVIAGGTDFVAMYTAGTIPAAHAVDVSRVPEMNETVIRSDGSSIGAATTLSALLELERRSWAAVADGAALVGSVQTRNRATLGGNACRASPSGDTLPGLLVTGAEMIVRSVEGTRRIPAHEFFLGPGRNALRQGEYLECIELPSRGTVSAYHRATTRRAMDLATVGVAVAVATERDVVADVQVAIGGAAPKPVVIPEAFSLFSGRAIDETYALLGELDVMAQDVIDPIDDVRGSAWYRRRLIKPLLERTWHTMLGRRDAWGEHPGDPHD